MINEIDVAKYIDQSLLKPAAIAEEVAQCCNEAVQYNFPAVCVYPSAVKEVREILHNKRVEICTVIGFPTGANTPGVKLYEAQEAVENGATELDIVINLGWLKSRQLNKIHDEIAQICETTGKTVKAILETAVLTDEEKQIAAEVCMDAGVAYLKTSTGWFGGATVADVKLLKDVSGGKVGIKASGGIHTIDQAKELIIAGATRLGTSRGVDLIRQQNSKNK